METNSTVTISEVMYRGFLCRQVEDQGWTIIMGQAEYLFPSLTDAKLAINGLHEDCVKRHYGVRIQADDPAEYSKPQTRPFTPAAYHITHMQDKPKGRISGCIAMILTILYAVFLLLPFADIGMDTIGNYIAMQMVMPHMLCVVLAAIFSAIGFFGKQRWAILTAGILMSVAAVLMLEFAPMVVVQAILFFISYARAK